MYVYEFISNPIFTHTLRAVYSQINANAAVLRNNHFNNFTCSSNLTLSIGATAVLEMAAAIPPAKKSFRKLVTPSLMLGCVELR